MSKTVTWKWGPILILISNRKKLSRGDFLLLWAVSIACAICIFQFMSVVTSAPSDTPVGLTKGPFLPILFYCFFPFCCLQKSCLLVVVECLFSMFYMLWRPVGMLPAVWIERSEHHQLLCELGILWYPQQLDFQMYPHPGRRKVGELWFM